MKRQPNYYEENDMAIRLFHKFPVHWQEFGFGDTTTRMEIDGVMEGSKTLSSYYRKTVVE